VSRAKQIRMKLLLSTV